MIKFYNNNNDNNNNNNTNNNNRSLSHKSFSRKYTNIHVYFIPLNSFIYSIFKDYCYYNNTKNNKKIKSTSLISSLDNFNNKNK